MEETYRQLHANVVDALDEARNIMSEHPGDMSHNRVSLVTLRQDVALLEIALAVVNVLLEEYN